MKFERDLHIKNSSISERDNCFTALESLGCRHVGTDFDFLSINVCSNPLTFQTAVDGDVWVGSEILTHAEFMSKYSNQFREKIIQAMSDFGLGREELSRKLGYSDPYITKMLTLPQSEKVKKKVSEKIDNLYQPKKSIGTLVVDLEQSPEFKKAIAETRDEIKKVAEENEQLKKELDHKNQVLDKRNDLFKDAEYEIASLNKTIESLQTVLNEKNEDIEGIKAAFGRVTKVGSNQIVELETLNKQLGIDLSKRNKDVSLLNFGCMSLCLIILVMACFW